MCMMKWLPIILFFQVNFAFCQDLTDNGIRNQLENTDSSLSTFLTKMKLFSIGDSDKVKIYHFGDSHIQPDNFSGEVRRQIQGAYGNGGRGFVFPYALAKTNGPKDFIINSDIQWVNSWNIHNPQKFDLGLAGMSVQSTVTEGKIKVQLQKADLSNPYTKAFVIYTMENPEKGIITLNGFKSKLNSKRDFDTIAIDLLEEHKELNITFVGSKITLHGVYFENDKKGIVYNSAGVAGARYSDFNRTKLFFNHIPLLEADLVIISLGTNESFDSKYDPDKFENEVDSMISRLRKVSPEINILLTLPSENYRVKSGVPQANEVVKSVSQILRNQAYKHNCAIWDLYAAMGGKGSMLEWHKKGLVNNDHIHYWLKGYNKQGLLLYEAIQEFLKKNSSLFKDVSNGQ